MVLKALGPHENYDSDDDFSPDRVPLLKNAMVPPPYVVADPAYGSKSEGWNIRINEKVLMLALLTCHVLYTNSPILSSSLLALSALASWKLEV